MRSFTEVSEESLFGRLEEHFNIPLGKRYASGHWGVLQKIVYVDSTHQYVTDDFAVVHLSKSVGEPRVFIGEERKKVSNLDSLISIHSV